ncbi:Coq4 family protein [Synechococcus sp. CCY 9618]|uniref:Coq4 family protein n=1 Tax=Synechococcus sp. CCY 9618 TaxID=2815602 RepID=UPI001C22874D|nr:Coq4 family protein [Synechococcus sp. CCY 9618]
MARLQEALRSLRTLRLLGEIGRSGGDLTSVADLVDNFAGSRQMALCLERFLALPGARQLLAEAPPPLELDLEALGRLPRGSLGHSVAGVLQRLGYDPDFARPRPVDTPERWLIQRLATTHDIHHVVSGFATVGEGENGVLAITAVQIGFPAFVVLNTAAGFGSFRFQPERHALMSQAIARGMAMGLACAPFCVQRWEQGWERPLADWRRDLGLIDPIQEEPYALRRLLADLPVEL